MEKDIDYEKYYNNNELICENLANLIKNSEDIHHIMVSNFVSEFSRIKFIKELYIADSKFTSCDFPHSMENCIFKNVEFRDCNFSSIRLENVQFINCTFFRCTFYTIGQSNCTFTSSLIEDCIFKGCKLSGKNNFLSAEEIKNPTFIDCVLPQYITYDYIYNQNTKYVPEMHTTLYLFIESGKFICADGMINIDKCLKNGHKTNEFNCKFEGNENDLSISVEILNELINKRNILLSKMVLEKFNDK